MISFYLFLIDFFVPLLVSVSLYLIFDGSINLDYLILFISFSLSVILLSIIKSYYDDYYLIHFSEKIKIAFSTWIFAIFIQLIILNHFRLEINLLLLLIWILIPIILIVKYIIKKKSKYATKYDIHLIKIFILLMSMKLKL